MNRYRLGVVGMIIAATALIALAAPALAPASAVTQWNANAVGVLTGPAAWQAPPVSTLHLAMVHGAVYDAVNAIDRGYTPYLTSPTATPFDSQDAAAATAAYYVLSNILSNPALASTTAPGQLPGVTALYNAALAAIPDGPAKTGGISAGLAAANAMIAARARDGRFGPFRFPFPTAPGPSDVGVWRPVLPAFGNDPNAWIKDVKPFLIKAEEGDLPSDFRSKGPWPLTSPQYAREFNEVKSVGSLNSATRTADQTAAARYWATHPPVTWSRIFRALDVRFGLSTIESARLYAMLYMTASDAFIAVWDDKAHWLFWRPITAIQEAGSDGNAATDADPAWLPLIANPPYPDHPSGHLGLSGAFVATLQDFFKTDEIAFSDTNPAVNPPFGLTRSWASFSAAREEIINARVWSGIHFRAADEQAARIAKEIAQYRNKHHYFKAVHGG
jgi:hypothetical protein